MQSQTTASARVLVYINAQPFGRCAGFEWTSDTPRRDVAVVDSLVPPELIPLFTRVVGNVSVVKTMGDGGLEGAGIIAQLPHIPEEKYFTISLVDRRTDLVLFRADNCAVTSQAWRVEPKDIVKGAFQFRCIVWSNEFALAAGS